MRELKKQLGDGTITSPCLLYGEESYLIDYYTREAKRVLVQSGTEQMNLTILTGKEATAAAISDVCETLPFLSGKRLVIIKDSKLFVSGRSDESEKVCAYLPELPDSSILLFAEAEIDKRGRLYKKLAELGRAVEFKRQDESMLAAWVANVLKKENAKASQAVIHELIRKTGTDMNTLNNEINKLCAYANGREIKNEDIDFICIKSTEARIFELINAVANKNVKAAFDILSALVLLKEPPVVVLSLIARQLRLIAQCKFFAEKKLPQQLMSEKLSVAPFIVRDCVKQSANFSMDKILHGLSECLKTDMAIKSGRQEARLAVELFIVDFCGR